MSVSGRNNSSVGGAVGQTNVMALSSSTMIGQPKFNELINAGLGVLQTNVHIQ